MTHDGLGVDEKRAPDSLPGARGSYRLAGSVKHQRGCAAPSEEAGASTSAGHNNAEGLVSVHTDLVERGVKG